MMKWVGIAGSWRDIHPDISIDVKREVSAIVGRGDGIVTGGALGVDFLATAAALEVDPTGQHLRVILPTSLDAYAKHYKKRAKEGVITDEQTETLITQLNRVAAAGSLVETPSETSVEKRTYYLRNEAVVSASDKLIAFQVNNSAGTQDTINKARAAGKPVRVLSYNLEG